MVSYNNYNCNDIKFNKHKYHSYYPITEIRFKFIAMKYPFQLHSLDHENKLMIERLLNSTVNNKNNNEMEMYDCNSEDTDYFNLTLDNNEPINFINNNFNNSIPSRRHRNSLYLTTHDFKPEKYAEKSMSEVKYRNMKNNVIVMEKIKLTSFMTELEKRIDKLLTPYNYNNNTCPTINSNNPKIYHSTDEQLINKLLTLNPLMFSETSFHGSYSLQSKLNIMYHIYESQ
jgi:hypothetical protein